MPSSKKVQKHLEKAGVTFEVVPHRKVYTAYDLAQTMGAKLDDIAKSLLVKVELPKVEKKGPAYYVVVVPANSNLDFQKLKKALKAKKVQMAPEKVMKKLGIEPGAMSPFGSLRDLGVVLDKGLTKLKKVIVGAETFTESVHMKVKDLIELEEPVIALVGKRNTLKLQKRKAAKKKPRKGTKKGAKGRRAAGSRSGSTRKPTKPSARKSSKARTARARGPEARNARRGNPSKKAAKKKVAKQKPAKKKPSGGKTSKKRR